MFQNIFATLRDNTKLRNVVIISSFVLIAAGVILVSSGNNQKKITSSKAAPASSVESKSTFMRQTLNSLDGKTGWYRDCRIDTKTGIDFNNCTKWYPPVDLTTVRGVGNESYAEYGAFTYIKNGQLTLRQNQISYDGKKQFSRDCPVDPEKGLTFTGCTGWTESDISNLRGKGNEAYGAYTGFIFKKNNQNILREAVYSLDGKVGSNRDCTLGTDGLSFSQCTAWSGDIDLTNLRGTKASTGVDETYGGFSGNVYTIVGRQYLRQGLLTLDGQKAYLRTCAINDATGVDFNSCSSWEDMNISSIRGVGNETYGGFEEFTYNLDNRPNIIVLMVDDLDVNLMKSLVNAGKLPNLKNYLLSQGTDFDNSFVTNSVCCPSRATFLTGQYSHNSGTYNNDAVTHGSVTYLKDSSTIATWLQNSGYVTSLIGKYLHYYGSKGPLPANLPVSPEGQNLKAEYENYVPPGWTNWQGLIDFSTYKMYGYKFNDNGTVKDEYRDENNPANYQTDVISQKAQEFIKSTVQPFFLYLTPLAPHVEVRENFGLDSYDDSWKLTVRPAPRHLAANVPPFVMPTSFNEQDISDKPQWLRLHPTMSPEDMAGNNALYLNRSRSMLAIDDMVGNVVARLKDTGKLDNTVFIFTSDNGFLHGEHRLTNKMYAFEESIRVPLIITGPGFAKNQVNHKIVLNNDLPVTIADIAGVQPSHTVDGRSILPIAANPSAAWRNKLFVEHWPHLINGQPNSLRIDDLPQYVAVRTFAAQGAQNKAYIEYTTNEKEFYDLEADLPEMSSKHADSSEQSEISLLASWIAGFKSCKGSSCWALEDSNGSSASLNSLNSAKVSIKTPPKVEFKNLRSGLSYMTNTTIRLEASTTGSNKISKVEFYDGGTKLGEDTIVPYQYSVRLSTPKTYRFIAKAVDSTGLIGQSTVTNILGVAPTKFPTKVVTKAAPTVTKKLQPTITQKIFRAATATPKPVLKTCSFPSAPTNLSVTFSPTASQPNRYVFRWNSVVGASFYSIRINNLSNGWSNTTTMNSGDMIADPKTNEFITDLTPGQGYGWWVHSRGSCGSWSDPTVSVGPSPKTLSVSCSRDSRGNVTGKITWTQTSSLQYALRVDNRADGWSGTCSSKGGDFCSTQQGTSKLFVAKEGAQYGIWVHSISNIAFADPPTFALLNCKTK